MPQLISPIQVVTTAKDGEVKVTIVLEINLSEKIVKESKQMDFDVPELSSDLMVEFGKVK